ncbi:MAG: hypothetical protein M2R45_01362 [Verrucomicrobia subdivision 3 bacterium]|nr:hypothetical protein [Limisphaerales bacterium]MCS1416018.1 hypothetical protein [Limisphaerales bacterium]
MVRLITFVAVWRRKLRTKREADSDSASVECFKWVFMTGQAGSATFDVASDQWALE